MAILVCLFSDGVKDIILKGFNPVMPCYNCLTPGNMQRVSAKDTQTSDFSKLDIINASEKELSYLMMRKSLE